MRLVVEFVIKVRDGAGLSPLEHLAGKETEAYTPHRVPGQSEEIRINVNVEKEGAGMKTGDSQGSRVGQN